MKYSLILSAFNLGKVIMKCSIGINLGLSKLLGLHESKVEYCLRQCYTKGRLTDRSFIPVTTDLEQSIRDVRHVRMTMTSKRIM